MATTLCMLTAPDLHQSTDSYHGSMTAALRSCRTARQCYTPIAVRRSLSQATLECLSEPVQAYISTSRDPYLNLSIEHYLLQKSAPASAVLFLYVNRSSIIIGRNQNPWLEVNLALLNAARKKQPETDPLGLGVVDLVRRRSGGGTVLHGEGNVNWTVICPSAKFTRDKHAEMVVRTLRSCGVNRARVNPRHDIVLDQGERTADSDPEDTHSTAYQTIEADSRTPLKVSGSAYKLTRGRALHHGTCLLSSPNLNVIPDYLHSPAKSYLTARGVESVSSPVGNIGLANGDFVEAVRRQFARMYSPSADVKAVDVGQKWLEDEDVRKGFDELKSLDWTFLQTPQFTLTSRPQGKGPCRGVQHHFPVPTIEMIVRYGTITDCSIVHELEVNSTRHRGHQLIGAKLHEIKDWHTALTQTAEGADSQQQGSAAKWLETMLPPVIST